MTNYPPGVTDQNFDELAFSETYRLGRECIVCHEPLPDQADEFCSYCEPELTYEEEPCIVCAPGSGLSVHFRTLNPYSLCRVRPNYCPYCGQKIDWEED